jgi:hypothetical protein
MKRWLPHLGIALGIAIAVYALFFAESAEDRVRAQLDALAETIAVRGEENPVLRGARVKKAFEGLLLKEVNFEIPELTEGQTGRNELVRLATMATQLYQSARVDLGGLSIDVDKSETTAMAHGEALLIGVRRTGEPVRDHRSVALHFDKIDDEWLIVSISVSLPLETR